MTLLGREWIPSRLVQLEDAEQLAELAVRNRLFMEQWDPVRPEEYFTVAGRLAGIREAVTRFEQGTSLPHVILDRSSEVAGAITISGIVRGALLSGSIGYWVSQDRNHQGLATAAVAHVKSIAFGELGLHRLQAEILPHNAASRRVLERNDFIQYGVAPSYMRIAGRWQDHELFQVLNFESGDS